MDEDEKNERGDGSRERDAHREDDDDGVRDEVAEDRDQAADKGDEDDRRGEGEAPAEERQDAEEVDRGEERVHRRDLDLRRGDAREGVGETADFLGQHDGQAPALLVRMALVAEEGQHRQQHAHDHVHEAVAEIAARRLHRRGVLFQPEYDRGLEVLRVGQHLGDDLFAPVAEPRPRRLKDVGHLRHHRGNAVGVMAKEADAERGAAAEDRHADDRHHRHGDAARRGGKALRERLRDAVEDQVKDEAADKGGDDVLEKHEDEPGGDDQPGGDLCAARLRSRREHQRRFRDGRRDGHRGRGH